MDELSSQSANVYQAFNTYPGRRNFFYTRLQLDWLYPTHSQSGSKELEIFEGRILRN
ncbi:hypothetical protein CVS40_9124 [Lucilia cuprina]|nr:hypothetical protein CVS40_9124 [Lucilia cuprina]